jgi:hypothetical protein
MNKDNPRIVKLSPSDFAFLMSESPRRAYDKLVYGLRAPDRPMPGVFSKIDKAMKNDAVIESIISKQGIDGKVSQRKSSVKSKLINFHDGAVQMYVQGRMDTLIELEGEEEDISFEVCDLKTATPSLKTLDKYLRQLMAYGFALEHPNEGSSMKISHVSILGFDPSEFCVNEEGQGVLTGEIGYFRTDYDEGMIMEYMSSLADIVVGDAPDVGGDEHYKYAARLTEIEEERSAKMKERD